MTIESSEKDDDGQRVVRDRGFWIMWISKSRYAIFTGSSWHFVWSSLLFSLWIIWWMWDESKKSTVSIEKNSHCWSFSLCRQVKIKTDDAKTKNKKRIYKAAPYSSKIQTLFQWLIATKIPVRLFYYIISKRSRINNIFEWVYICIHLISNKNRTL